VVSSHCIKKKQTRKELYKKLTKPFMNEKVKIPFDSDDRFTTYSLMERLGISREEANKILWDMYDKQFVDLIPVLNKEKVNELLEAEIVARERGSKKINYVTRNSIF
jgi:hypothetical protein